MVIKDICCVNEQILPIYIKANIFQKIGHKSNIYCQNIVGHGDYEYPVK